MMCPRNSKEAAWLEQSEPGGRVLGIRSKRESWGPDKSPEVFSRGGACVEKTLLLLCGGQTDCREQMEAGDQF